MTFNKNLPGIDKQQPAKANYAFKGFETFFTKGASSGPLLEYEAATSQARVRETLTDDGSKVPSMDHGRIADGAGHSFDSERLFFALRMRQETGDVADVRYAHVNGQGGVDAVSELHLPRRQAHLLERLARMDYAKKKKHVKPNEQALLYAPKPFPFGQSIEQTEDGTVTQKRQKSDGGDILFKNGALDIPVAGKETISLVCEGAYPNGSPVPDSYQPSTNIISISKNTLETYRKNTENNATSNRREQSTMRHELNHMLFDKLPREKREKIIDLFAKRAKDPNAPINRFYEALYDHPGDISEHYVKVAESNLKTIKAAGESPKVAYMKDKKGVKREIALQCIVDELLAFASEKEYFPADAIKAAPGKQLDATQLQNKKVLETAAATLAELDPQESAYIWDTLFEQSGMPNKEAVKRYMEALMSGIATLAQERKP